jgi:Subtilase family/Carboxypeptidase regulatory-like domain
MRRRSQLYALAVLLLVPLLAQPLGSALAPALGAAAPASHTLLIDASDAAALNVIAQSGAVRLADYGAFSLWRAGDGVARTIGRRPGVALHDDFTTIWLRSGALDTRGAGPTVPANLKQARAAGPQLWMLQFVGPIQDRWLDQVRAAGARLVSYMPNNAYVVWADDTALQALEGLAAAGASIQWTGPYHPAYRLAPSLLGLAGQPGAGMVDVTVQFYTTNTTSTSLDRLRAIGGAVYKAEQRVLDFTNITLQVPTNQIARLAREPDVFNIEPWSAPRKFDEMQSQIIAGNISSSGGKIVPAGPGYLAWLAARGLPSDSSQYPIVDVVDDGIDNGTTTPLHPDFYRLGARPGTSRVVAIGNCTSDPAGDSLAGHGNLNAGIVGGYNNRPNGAAYTDSAGFHYGLGVAPYTRISGTKIFKNSGQYDVSRCGNTDAGVVAASYSVGAAITSDSWGCGPGPFGSGCSGSPYDSTAQAYDALTRDATTAILGNQEMLHVFAAGNDGSGARTIGTPGTAKNVITVGATENVRENGVVDGCGESSNDNADDITGFSSRGPTADGRIKPDIMAPGSHIIGLASQDPGYNGTGVCNQYHPNGQTLYAWSSGTSHSTPAVAGAAALLHTYYRVNIGGGTPPSPAMLKAFMLNGARYLDGAGTGGTLPSNAQGWGDVYLARAFDTAPKLFFDQTETFGATGATFVRTGQVATNAQPFRVTLAWTDAPGSTTGAAYVNNLDLEVTVGGQTYRGNVFSGANSITGGAADSRNNVENVFLPAGVSGPFTVKVTAANIAGDGVPKNADLTDQDFALVIYNGLSTTSGVVHGRVTHTTTSTPIAGAEVRAAAGGAVAGTALTDAAGDYQLTLPPGTYVMTATANGYTSQTFPGVAVTAGNSTTRDFTLSGGVLHGRVRDSFTPGRPIAGATVGDGTYTATSGLDGNYTFLLPGGSHTVVATRAGYGSQTVADVAVSDSMTTTLDFTLPGGALAGAVVDSIAAQPIAGASVTIGADVAVADAGGRYALRAPPGSYTVAVAKAGYLSGTFNGVTITSGITTTLDAVLTPTLSYAPGVLTRTLTFGQAITDTPGLTLTNNSTVALTATLIEIPGSITQLAAQKDILVVGRGLVSPIGAITPALAALGYTYDVIASSTFEAMPLADIQSYQVVIYAGNTGSFADSPSNLKLMAYLDAGGRLLIADNDLGFFNHGFPFYTTYLQATYNEDDAAAKDDLRGEDIMAGVDSSVASDPYPDTFTPGPSATRIFQYGATGFAAGARIARGSYKAIYFAFDYDNLGTAATGEPIETTVMQHSLEWLLEGASAGIPWLQETPSTVTIPPATSVGVQIGWFADRVPQLGIYTGTLQLRSSQTPTQAASISVTMMVEDVGGFVVSTTGLDTTEAGGVATFDIRLSSAPTAPVTIGLSSSDTTEGTVAPASLTFTVDNWNVAQTVTIRGVDDAVDDGDQVYTIITTPASSADPRYAGLDPPDITLTNADDDTAGATIAESGGNTAVAEGGATDTYTIVLDSQPTASVAISFDTGTQIQPIAVLIFTPANWNIPQTVTVRAVDDNLAEGPRSATIAHRASSADPKYNGAALAIPGVVVAITDNDPVSAPRSVWYLPLIVRP